MRKQISIKKEIIKTQVESHEVGNRKRIEVNKNAEKFFEEKELTKDNH